MRGDDGRGVLRSGGGRETTLPAVRLADGELVLRTPRPDDARSWSTARLENRTWLERAFPAWGDDWAAEQSEAAWVQRCAMLRRAAARGLAKPFVLLLDGRLVGEIGIDAVDEVSRTGEASVWMVRSHGSGEVMLAASLLLVEHAFTDEPTVTRVLSPVATSSRAGRAPGLRAVGFEIEATVPRKVGDSGLVDHDMWLLHRSDDTVRRTREALAALRAAAPDRPAPSAAAAPTTPTTPRAALVSAVGRAAWRGARDAGRRVVAPTRDERTPRPLAVAGTDGVVLRPGTAADLTEVTDPAASGSHPLLPGGATTWALDVGGRPLAVLGHRTDVGTGTTEVHVVAGPDLPEPVLAAGLGAVLDDLRPATDEPRLLVVRVPADAAPGSVPSPAVLTGLGLERIATYPAHADDLDPWLGEDLWRAAPR